MRLVGERLQFGLRYARIGDVEFDGEAEAAGGARTDADLALDHRLGRILLVLLRHEVEGAAETGGVSGGEQVLRRGRSGLAWAAHLFGNGQIGGKRVIICLGVAVAAARRAGFGGEKNFDAHGGAPLEVRSRGHAISRPPAGCPYIDPNAPSCTPTLASDRPPSGRLDSPCPDP